MNYKAVAGKFYGIDGIVARYSSEVNFCYENERGFTGFQYTTSIQEFVDYYPIISVEEARELLKEGTYINDFVKLQEGEFDRSIVCGVELMYRCQSYEEYFQPFYCFYLKQWGSDSYSAFYVPAVRGVNIEDMLPPEQEVKVVDIRGYEPVGRLTYVRYNQYYTFKNEEFVEIEKVNIPDEENQYGETTREPNEGDLVFWFHYEPESIHLNLTEIIRENTDDGIIYDEISASYIDGKILIRTWANYYESEWKYLTALYVYSQEDQSLIQTVKPTSIYNEGVNETGLEFYGGRYATRVNTYGEVQILDLLDGSLVNVGVLREDVAFIEDASDQHLVCAYKNGGIAVFEKESGQLIKESNYKISFVTSEIVYQDEMLYIETYSAGVFVLIISKFE